MYNLSSLIDALTNALNLTDFEGNIQLRALKVFLRLPGSVFFDLDKEEIDRLLSALKKALDPGFWNATNKASDRQRNSWILAVVDNRDLTSHLMRPSTMIKVHALKAALLDKLTCDLIAPEFVSEISGFLDAIGMEAVRIHNELDVIRRSLGDKPKNEELIRYFSKQLDELLNGAEGNRLVDPAVSLEEETREGSNLLRMREILFFDLPVVVSEIRALKPEKFAQLSPLSNVSSLFSAMFYYRDQGGSIDVLRKGLANFLSHPEILSALVYEYLRDNNPFRLAPVMSVIDNILLYYPESVDLFRASDSPIRLLYSLLSHDPLYDDMAQKFVSSLRFFYSGDDLSGFFDALQVLSSLGHPWKKKWVYYALARLISYENEGVIEKFCASGLFILIHKQLDDPTNVTKFEILKLFATLIVHMKPGENQDVLKLALRAIYDHALGSPKIVDEALAVQVLCDLVSSKCELADTIRHELLELGLIETSTVMLRRYVDNDTLSESIRANLAAIIHILATKDALSDTNFAPLLDPLFDVLLMPEHVDFERIKSKKQAMLALSRLACGSHEQQLQIALRLGDVFNRILMGHNTHVVILNSLLATFRYLTRGNKEVKSVLMSNVALLLQWFDMKHNFGRDNSVLLTNAAAALWDLADEGPDFQRFLLSEAAFPVLFKQFSLSDHRDVEMDRCLAGALKRLCFINTLNGLDQFLFKTQLFNDGSVKSLLTWLSDPDKSRVTLALDIFLGLIESDYRLEQHVILLAFETELPTVFNLVCETTQSIKLRQLAAQLLWNLVANIGKLGLSIKQKLLDLGLVEQWLVMLADEKLPLTLKTWLVRILRVLSMGNSSIRGRLAAIVAPLFDLLAQSDEGMLDIQRHAMATLWNLACEPGELQQLIVTPFHEVLEKMLDNPRVDPELLRLALGAHQQLSIGDDAVKSVLMTNRPLLLTCLLAEPERSGMRVALHTNAAAVLWNLAAGGPQYQLALLRDGFFLVLLRHLSQSEPHDTERDRCLVGALQKIVRVGILESSEHTEIKNQLCRDGSVALMLTLLSDPDKSKVKFALSVFTHLTNADYGADNPVRLMMADFHEFIFSLCHEKLFGIEKSALILYGNLLCNAEPLQKKLARDAHGEALINDFLSAEPGHLKSNLAWVLTNLLCFQFEYIHQLYRTKPAFCEALIFELARLPTYFGPQDMIYTDMMAQQLIQAKSAFQAIGNYSFFGRGFRSSGIPEEGLSATHTGTPALFKPPICS